MGNPQSIHERSAAAATSMLPHLHLLLLRLPLALCLAGAVAMGGCGKGGVTGGGDDAGDDTPPPALPELVAWGAASGPLIVSEQSGSTLQIGFNASGTWNRATQATTLSPSPGTLRIDSEPEHTTFTVSVVETFSWVDGAEPDAGTYLIVLGNEETAVRVMADAGGPGVPGVAVLQRLDYMPVDTLFYSWGEWRDLTGDAPEWARRASLGYETFQSVLSELEIVLDGFAWIFEHNPELTDAEGTGVDVATPTYPGTGSAGRICYTWLDDTNDGQIDPADGFRIAFTNSWCDDPGSHPDLLQDGAIRLANYTENATPFLTGAVLTFESLLRRETKHEAGVWHIERESTITGGFNVSLAASGG